MSKRIIFVLLLLPLCLGLAAQEVEEPSFEDLQLQIQAMSDSLLQLRESEVISAYGFKDTDKLADVAAKLEIRDLERWKEYLGIEPKNEVLDRMSLRRLGITPFRALLAQQYSIYGFTELSSIGELAAQKQLPVKKLRQFAGIDSADKSFDNYSLQALNRTPEELVTFENDFNDNKMGFGLSILGFGVLIVFSALALTALVISQLKHLNAKPKKTDSALVLTPSGKVKARPVDMNADVIAAAITALHLHKHDIEERRRLLLTFRRAGSDQWRGSVMLNMPNREILRKRS
ncbi:MAG: OadG family protein [Candidatus Cloacimonetes bacterium]|nr:OadG family protein [Candidatus Cloacimonadota bacterium]MDY0366651.1 OadG family protein [Candidatus Syntrophosphaera sp.]